MGEVIKRRFSAYPVLERDSEEDKALQAIPLQESKCLWKETYVNDTAEVGEAGYYFYLNEYNREFLVIEVKVRPAELAGCSAERIREYVDRIYKIGMELESEHRVLPEHIRADSNEHYCIRRLSYSVGEWLTGLQADAANTVKAAMQGQAAAV